MPEPSHHDVDTMLQHLGEEEHVLGAVTPPIFQTSLFVFETCDEFAASFTIGTEEKRRANYSRIGNPTVHVVNEKIAALEHCDEGMVFSSGMAAISAAILSEVEAGVHVVAVDTCYGPTKQFITEYLPRFGVSHTLVEGSDPDEILAACKPETKLIYLESPSSIIFRIQDLETVCRAAKELGITTAIDNSYASPIFQTPHDFGVDMILHSATKYLAGHSDVVAGALATDRKRMDRIMKGEVALLGAILPPFPAWLLLRGMRTLPVRLRAVQETGNAVAAWLDERSEAARVFHVGSAKHPQRGLIDKQMRGSTGLLSFEPRCQDFDKLKVFADSLELYQMGVSWGGHESLCVPLTYHPLGWEEQRWLVRLYNGLESPRDLIADLEQAFVKAGL